MDRREVIKRLSALVGGAVVLPAAMRADSPDWSFSDQLDFSKLKVFTKKQRKLLAELAETICPRTATPGATDAKVGPFIELILQDCREQKDRDAFIAGLNAVEAECKTTYKMGFVKLPAEKRTELLTKMEADASTESKARKMSKATDQPPIFWNSLKSMTIWGFFTSEAGQTQALNYVMTPDRKSVV